jgi:hypothetical protein
MELIELVNQPLRTATAFTVIGEPSEGRLLRTKG